MAFATKPQIALTLIKQVLADGVAPAPVLADAAYGNGFGFRQRGVAFSCRSPRKPTTPGRKRYPRPSTASTVPWAPRASRPPAPCWTSPGRCPPRLGSRVAGAWAANGQWQHTRLAWQGVFLARCLKLNRSRWHVEHYFQRSNDDLGFDPYEGRSWRGFHHHPLF